MRRIRFCGAIAALAAGSVVLTGCAASGGAGSAGSTGGVIEIGVITPEQSQATSLPWLAEGAQAAVDQINAAGGVDGHRLQLNACNGEFDPATELRCAQQAVDGKDVAMVGQLIANGAQVDPLLTRAQLANIGVNSVSAADAQAQSSFVLDPGVLGYLAFAPTLKKELHVSRIAVLNTDTSAYGTSLAVERLGAKDAGVDIVREIRVPEDATDMSLYIAQAQAAGAQALAINLIQTQVLATWKALAAVHSPLKVVVDQTSVSNNIKAAGAAADGSFGITSTPQSIASSPWVKAYTAAMKKYQPGKDAVSAGLDTYEAVQLFATAARQIKGGNITRQSVWQAMSRFDRPFAWFSDLDYAKPGPVAGYPRIAQITSYPVIIEDGIQKALPSFDPATPQ